MPSSFPAQGLCTCCSHSRRHSSAPHTLCLTLLSHFSGPSFNNHPSLKAALSTFPQLASACPAPCPPRHLWSPPVTGCSLELLRCEFTREASVPGDRADETASVLFSAVILAIRMLPALCRTSKCVNPAVCYFVFRSVKDRAESGRTTHTQGSGPGPSAHRPAGTAPGGGQPRFLCPQCTHVASLWACTQVLLGRPKPLAV